jgi:hypothetical protein
MWRWRVIESILGHRLSNPITKSIPNSPLALPHSAPSSFALKGQVPRGIESRPLRGIRIEGEHMDLCTS